MKKEFNNKQLYEKLYNEIVFDLKRKNVKDVYKIIISYCIMFDVVYVTQDVVDTIRKDYNLK